MSDFTIRADSVNVEQIMRQIRARIREKRGVDYTEQEIRELAAAKLEKFLDPENVRSELLQEFRRVQQAAPPLPNYVFEDTTLFESHRAPIRWLRRLMLPLLKLFLFNPNPLIQALHIQSQLNSRFAQETRERADLTYEVIHNLVVELTRLSIEAKNLKMRVESMSSRLDFDERRSRALEGVVQYRPGATAAPAPPAHQVPGDEDEGEASKDEAEGPGSARGRRRRHRRGRKGGMNRVGPGPESARGPSGTGEGGEARLQLDAAETQPASQEIELKPDPTRVSSGTAAPSDEIRPKPDPTGTDPDIEPDR